MSSHTQSGQRAPAHTTGAWNILCLSFRKSDGFKASPSCGNSSHTKEGATKDITAVTFIKKAWQSMSHAQTAFQMLLINGCANYTFIAINFISIMPLLLTLSELGQLREFMSPHGQDPEISCHPSIKRCCSIKSWFIGSGPFWRGGGWLLQGGHS